MFLMKVVVFGKVGLLLITWEHVGDGGVRLERVEAGPAIGDPGRWFALRDADGQMVPVCVAIFVFITAESFCSHGRDWWIRIVWIGLNGQDVVDSSLLLSVR